MQLFFKQTVIIVFSNEMLPPLKMIIQESKAMSTERHLNQTISENEVNVEMYFEGEKESLVSFLW